MSETKKRGRPRKASSERAPTVNFTMRIAPKLLEQLRRFAEAGQRSISAEAERRLSQPETNEVGRMVSRVVDAIERREGKLAAEDETVRVQCRAGVEFVINLFLGQPLDEERTRQVLAYEISRARRELAGEPQSALDSILGHKPMSIEEAQEKLDLLALIERGKRSASDLFEEPKSEPEK